MRTDQLVQILAADAGRMRSPRSLVIGAALGSAAVVVVLLAAIVGVRPDLPAALTSPPVALKFVFTGSAAVAAVAYAIRAMRPEDRSRPLRFILPVLALLVLAVTAELCLTPSADWVANARGVAPLQCGGIILALSLPATAALLYAMRFGAPVRPALAGGAAGLGGSAIGAAAFALYCPNDSVLFVALWYVPAFATASLAGAAVGAKSLSW